MADLFVRPKDRAHEREVASLIETAWGCDVTVEPSPVAPYDLTCWIDGAPKALVEVKDRHGSLAVGEYAGVVLSVEKIEGIIRAADARGVVPVFVVTCRFNRRMWTILDGALDLPRRREGRTKNVRRPKDHAEPVVDLPWHWFHEIGRWEATPWD